MHVDDVNDSIILSTQKLDQPEDHCLSGKE